jgi:hypothetical protein
MKYIIIVGIVAAVAVGFVIYSGGTPEPVITAMPTASEMAKPAATKTASPTKSVAPTATPTQAVQATPDMRCIVTINGDRYDVTTFRKIHKGGDVFKCGTDMSAEFANQHPVSFLLKYSGLKVQ